MDDLTRWILLEGPDLELEALARGLGERLGEHAPVARVFTFTLALHPVTYGVGVLWKEDGSCQTLREGWAVIEESRHQESPISRVMKDGREFRVRLDGGPYEYALLEDFASQGLTEWLGLPMDLGTWFSVLALSTAAPGGFSEEQRVFLRDVAAALAPVLRAKSLERTARGILDTYLGPHAGRRVWDGKIRHGDGDDIHSVIWFCDLRKSTPLADALERPVFMALLDQFFGAMAGAIQDGGGEVLRYIGDAVLAIFPIEEGAPEPAVEAAIRSARDARGRMAVLNAERSKRGEEPLEFGIGLHLGHVMYGNIGTPTRLEFSVIGAAANEAARVESMCKVLGREVLVSDAVAEHTSQAVEPLGDFELRGVSRVVPLFALD